MDQPGPWALAAVFIVGGAVAVMLYLAGPAESPRSAATTLPSIPPATAPPTTALPVTTLAPNQPPQATEVSTLASWEKLTPPFERIWNPAVVWTGDELIVWGGDVGGQPWDGNNVPTSAGYRYDTAADEWESIAHSDLCPAGEARGIWTDTELVVWPGGSVLGDDCPRFGAYDPATDTWRYLDEQIFVDFFGRIGVDTSVVWTGELLVAPSIALAVDPMDGPLLQLPNLPRNADDAVFSPRLAHWTGDQVLVLGSADLYAWTPGDDEWLALDAPPIPDRARTSAWDGERLLAVNYELQAARWDGEVWTALDPLPLRFYECSPRGVTSGEILAIDFCGPLAVWDGDRQLFVPIPAPVDWGAHPDWRGGFPVATADSIFVFGDGVFRYRLTENSAGSLDLPTTMPIGVHFLDLPGDLELTRSIGPLGFDHDGEYLEVMRFEFRTPEETCSVKSTFLAVAPPPGQAGLAAVITSRTEEVVFGTEHLDDGSLTIRLWSRNKSDAIEVSCGDPSATRVFAAQFWEPEY